MSDELDRVRPALLAINSSVHRKECQILDELKAFDFEKIWNESKEADNDHEYFRRQAEITYGLSVFRGNLIIADQVLDGVLLVSAYDGKGLDTYTSNELNLAMRGYASWSTP
jgi:hypothetical protein